MLLDDRQAMINDLLVAYRESNDHYGDAADQLDDDAELGALFARIRASHERTVERLCALVRESGGLPREPDTDKEQARQLFTRLKAVLGGERRRIVLEDRIVDEKRIAALIDEALQLDFPADTHDWLQTLAQGQRETLLLLDGALQATRAEDS